MPEGKLDSEKWSTFKAVVSRGRVVKLAILRPVFIDRAVAEKMCIPRAALTACAGDHCFEA